MSAAATPQSMPPFAAYHPAADAGLSVTELRTAIQQRLRHTGALRTLKTQLRGMVLTDLMKNRRLAEGRGQPAMTLEEYERCRQSVHDHVNNKATCALHHAGETGAAAAAAPPLPSTWPGRIADCLIHNHLVRSARHMSLSIFATEAEVPPLSDSGAPADEEVFLCQLLGLPAGAGIEEEEPGRDSGAPRRQPSSIKSALQMLVEEALWRRGQQDDAVGHRHQCATQTDDFDPKSEETSPLTSMECRLAAVDAKYALTFSQMRQGGAAVTWRGEVERRLAQYKEELHSLLRAEYQQKYRTFEQTKLHECKTQMEEHYQTLREHHRQELEEKERTLVAKSEQDRQRLTHIREDLEQQRLRLERKQLDLITFQQEMEGEVEKLHVQLRDQRDKIQTLRFQCEKWEELCGSRLMEAESARAREMRRLEELRCAKAEHATEVHLLEEEIRHLRFRVQVLSQGGGGGVGTASASEEAGDGTGERGGKERGVLHYPVSASSRTRTGVVPGYYFTAMPAGVDGSGFGASGDAAGAPDDVEAFIHRTERSQKDEQMRLRAGVATDVHQSFLAAQQQQQQQQQQPSTTGWGGPQNSSHLSSSYRSPLSANHPEGEVEVFQQNGAGDTSRVETSSFIARDSSSLHDGRSIQQQQPLQQPSIQHSSRQSPSPSNNHNNTNSSVLQGSSSRLTPGRAGAPDAFYSSQSNLNPSNVGSTNSSPSTSQLWSRGPGAGAAAADHAAVSTSGFTGPTATSSPERLPPSSAARTSASSSPDAYGKPSVADTSSYRPEESPSTVRSQSTALQAPVAGTPTAAAGSASSGPAVQSSHSMMRESTTSGAADSSSAAAAAVAVGGAGTTSSSTEEQRDSAQVTGTNVDASSISAARQTASGSQQNNLTQRSEGSSLLAMAAKVLKPKKSPSSSSTTTTSSSSSSASSSASSTASKKRKQKAQEGKAAPVVNEAALRAKTSKLSSEEATARISVVNEEEDAFKGIAWSARSQFSVLQSKIKAQEKSSSTSNRSSNSSRSSRGRGTTWMMEQAAAARMQRQQEEDNIIYRDSDDDDSILYNSSSTASSF